MAKWITDFKIEDPLPPEEAEMYDDTVRFEISVLRESYKLGIDSWGWAGEDKIILFDDAFVPTGIGFTSEETEEYRGTLEKYKRIAKILAETLNKEGI